MRPLPDDAPPRCAALLTAGRLVWRPTPSAEYIVGYWALDGLMGPTTSLGRTDILPPGMTPRWCVDMPGPSATPRRFTESESEALALILFMGAPEPVTAKESR